MISGMVDGEGEAVVQLSVENPDGSWTGFDAAVDTGFNGFLALPGALIEVLALRSLGARQATLADGRQSPIRVFAGTVVWDDQAIEVLVHETVEGSLLGMALLWGYRLTLEAKTNGRDSIEKIEA
jgi:clan AA aspartic protease